MLRWQLLVVSLASVSVFGAAVPAQQRFDPLRHLAGPGHVVLEVSSLDALREGFATTLPGAVLLHPDTQAGTATLRAALSERFDELVAPWQSLTGLALADVGRLLSGGFTLAVGELSADGSPQLALALPAPHGADDLALAGRLLGLAFPGDPGAPRELGELTVTPLAGPAGPLAASLIGDHLVLATDATLLQIAHALWTTNAETESLALSPTHAALTAALGPRGSGLRLVVDLAAVRDALLGQADAAGDGERPRRKLAELGVERVDAFGVQVGFRDGGLAKTVHLGLRGGGDGVLDAFQAALLPVRRVDEALALLPAVAHEVSAFRIDPAATWTRLAERFPEELADMRAGLAEMQAESELGWSPVELFDRLPTLGDVEVFSFAVVPPAGGFFADRVQLVRTDELEPYWQFLLELLSGWNPGLSEREVGGTTLVTLDLVPAEAGAAVLSELLAGAGFDELPEAVKLGFALPLLAPVGNLARADIPGGWTVLSGSPHAVSRFLVLGPSSEPMASNEQASQRVHQVLGGAVMGSVFDTGSSLLAGYNSLLGLGDRLAPIVALLGVDVGRLPPAEAFLRHAAMGYVRVVSNEQGITIWAHRAGLPSVVVGLASGLWLGLAGAGAAATVVAPQVMDRLAEANVTIAQAKLTNLRQVIVAYRMQHGAVPDTLDDLLEPSEKNQGEPFLDDPELLLDPWGNAFVYERLSARKYALMSLGADGVEGGEGADADIIVAPRDG